MGELFCGMPEKEGERETRWSGRRLQVGTSSLLGARTDRDERLKSKPMLHQKVEMKKWPVAST